MIGTLLLVSLLAAPQISLLKLTLKGTDTTSQAQKQAIIATPNGQDEVFKLGDTIFGLGKLTQISPRSITLENLEDQKRITLFIDGGPEQMSLIDQQRALIPTLDNTKFDQVDTDVIKIRYNSSVSNYEYPSSVYLNRVGDNLYTNPVKLGLGNDAKTYVENGQNLGVEIGTNQRNSVLGGYGFIKGDVVTHINGKSVTSPEDVALILASSKSPKVSFTYLSSDRSSALMGTMVVKNSGA